MALHASAIELPSVRQLKQKPAGFILLPQKRFADRFVPGQQPSANPNGGENLLPASRDAMRDRTPINTTAAE
jgi:hypothetical protein